MPEPSNAQTPLSSIGATEARAKFADLIGRVAYGKERILFTRNGQNVGVLVPMEDYERLLLLEHLSADGKDTPSSSRT